jgi:trehalose 6-phosphate phosphatase
MSDAPADPSEEFTQALAPLVAAPASSAVVVDYDGTLAPIVEDPEAAVPAPGATAALADVADGFGLVAVVSGRPLSFLARQLGGVPDTVRLAGLYGLEQRGPEGVRLVEEAGAWAGIVQEVAARLRRTAPPGVRVEDKGLGVTVHWRLAPEAAAWAQSAADDEAARSGLRAQPGKMSVELRLPLEVDKGTALRHLVSGCSAVLFIGDDRGDLPAFAALARLRAEERTATVSVAVRSAETPDAVLEAADLTVEGPAGAVALLGWLARRARAAPG